MSIYSLLIPFAVIAVIFFLLLWRRQREKANSPGEIIKRFEANQIAQCKYPGKIFRINYQAATTTVPLEVKKCLADAWLHALRIADKYKFDLNNPFAQPERITFYLVPEELRSFETKTPSLVKAIDCSMPGGYCKADNDPQKLLLRLDANGNYDEFGKVAHKDVQVLTIAGRGLPETFGTDDQRLVVVVPIDLMSDSNLDLIKQGAINELEHLFNKVFEPGTFESNNQANHRHPLYPL